MKKNENVHFHKARTARMNIPTLLLGFREFFTIVLATIFILMLDRKSQWFSFYRPKYLKKIKMV